MKTNLPSEKYWAWNPGLESQLPREYLPLSTVFRAENVSTSIAKAHELSDFCGLPAERSSPLDVIADSDDGTDSLLCGQ
jgi:hypothetical protein